MFTSEQQLCQQFAEHAQSLGWVCFPEQSGWDMLLVKDTIQVGIQAKMKPNIKVIRQCLPPNYRRHPGVDLTVPGPHYRAVLVPKAESDYVDVCNAMHLACMYPHVERNGDIFWRDSGVLTQAGFGKEMLWQPSKVCWLPDIVPQHLAGVPSPTTISKWTQSALKAMAWLNINGTITSKQLSAYGVSPQLFVSSKWIVSTGMKNGKLTLYKEGPYLWRLLNKHKAEYSLYLQQAKDQYNNDMMELL